MPSDARRDVKIDRLMRALGPKLAEISGYPAQFQLGDGRVEKIVLSLGERKMTLTPRSDGYWSCHISKGESP